jgi:ubiquinone/menaquinone biosynthesis C-methylase UbiE
MRMNLAETLVINSAPRRRLQHTYEARLLRRLGGRMDGGAALEVGCGQGVGVEIILEQFGADRVVAFDLDERMIERARGRLADRNDRVDLSVGDVTAIDADDGTFDAVFDFGIIHHVPDWRAAVAEVRRVLKPGGRFYFEEVTSHALRRWSYRLLFDHPDHDRFSGEAFVDHLDAVGLAVGSRYVHRFFGDFVIGVAMKDD